MHRKDAIAWVVSVCAVSLRLSQAKTLSILVASAMRVERISLANIGRCVLGTAKHQIKRCWRFCSNHRIETADAMRGVVKKVLKKRNKHKPLIVALDWVAYRQHHSVTQNIVVRWVRNLPAKRDECWFLMSSLTAGPAQISRLYGQRMTIEQLFRDQKSKRNGWSLRDTQITRADRLDRLLLILAIAYLLLCGIGLAALQTCKPSQWTASSKNDCSVFTIGRAMIADLRLSVAQAFQALLNATEQAIPKWG